MNRCRLALVALASVFLAAIPAFAQAVAEAKPAINFGPLLDQLWPLLGVALTALASWVAARAAGYFKLQSADIVRDTLNQAMQRGLDYARVKVGPGPTLGVESRVVAVAAQYVIDHTPDALRYFKVDEQSLKEKLLARLGDAPSGPGTGNAG